MQDNDSINNILNLCKRALQDAEDQEIAPFGESRFEMAAAERVLSVVPSDQGFRLEIASDELDLKNKQLTEKILKNALADAKLGAGDLTIYFKRLKKVAPLSSRHSGGIAGQPKPVERPSSGPFGITMRKQAIPGVHRIIAISSGKGGVGKSTVSVQTALALARSGAKVGILDADIYGPSVPTMLGIEGPVPVSSDSQMIPIETLQIKCMSFGLLTDAGRPVIWRGPMVSKALEQLFYQTDWGELDYLVLDLPPGTGDVQLTMIERLPIYAGIIVSTPQKIALIDAQKGIRMFRRLNVPIMGIVENMSHFVCGVCHNKERVFGERLKSLAEEESIPMIAQIPLTSQLRELMDDGQADKIDFSLRGIFDELARSIKESKL